MFSKENENRIIKATQNEIKGSAYTRMFPELMPEAVKIVQAEQDMIKHFPTETVRIRELCQLKLDTLVPKLLCDEIQTRVNISIQAAAKKIKAWAKDKSFGNLLDAKGHLDKNKCRKYLFPKGKEEFKRVIAEYNDLCVPYANSLLDKDAWKPHEEAQARALQDLQRRHNALVIESRKFLKEDLAVA